MNRIAAIYDIHGNLPALEAVLDEVRRAAVDGVVVGGDVIPGPMGREALACLRGLDLPLQFIKGNGEREVLDWKRGQENAAIPEKFREVMRWSAQELQSDEEQWLGQWPATIPLEVNGLGKVLFCHATPRNDTEIFTRLTPEDRLIPVFAGAEAVVIVCGHTHMQFERSIAGTRIVNAGSVGMPYGKPGAYWALLGPDVELRHTSYDLRKAAARIQKTNYPQAREFAEHSVIEPPPEDKMLELLTKAEIR
jgi:predicted phosphodiesterase